MTFKLMKIFKSSASYKSPKDFVVTGALEDGLAIYKSVQDAQYGVKGGISNRVANGQCVSVDFIETGLAQGVFGRIKLVDQNLGWIRMTLQNTRSTLVEDPDDLDAWRSGIDLVHPRSWMTR